MTRIVLKLALLTCSLFSTSAMAGGPVTVDFTNVTESNTAGPTFDVSVSWVSTGDPSTCIASLNKWTGSGYTLVSVISVPPAGSDEATLDDGDYFLEIYCEGNDDSYNDWDVVYFGD
ncbi:MAG: hypothetical protein RKH07_03865 [Gammaproteobacteria bacterium]